MRQFCLWFGLSTSVPQMVFAHAGHWVDVAGHDHLLAGAAIGIAIAVGVAGALKGQGPKDETEEQDEDAADPELSEA